MRRSILVIEDDEGIRETIKDLLESEGYRVRTAENGLEGLQLLAEDEPPCLILLDLMMPVMDGWEFLKRYQQGGPRSSVVVVSAAADAAEVSRQFSCRVIRKPVDIDCLIDTARQCCGSA